MKTSQQPIIEHIEASAHARNAVPGKTISPRRTARHLPARLQRLFVFHATQCSAYAALLEAFGIGPNDVKTYQDWLKLPTVTKEMVLSSPPWGLVSGDRRQVARFLETSGSTGTPKVLAVSMAEKNRTIALAQRHLLAAGYSNDGVTMTIFPQGPWPSGFFIQNAAEAIGPTFTADVKMSDEWFASRFDMYRPRHIGSLPSFVTRLARILENAPLEQREDVKSITAGGERLYPAQRAHIQSVFPCAAIIEGYGSAELGVCATECPHHHGLHFFDDEYFVEVLNPNTGEPVEDGEYGELVVSCLFRKTAPMLRYRTGDLIRLETRRPGCGQKDPLFSYIPSRCDDVLVMGSCKVFPDDVWAAVKEFDELSEHFTLFLESDKATLLPRLRLVCEWNPQSGRPDGIEQKLLDALAKHSSAFSFGVGSGLAVKPLVELVHPGTLYQSQTQLKHRRFVDLRSQTEVPRQVQVIE